MISLPLPFQIYYVKAPQNNHAGVQYAPANAFKIAYAPAPQPQHSSAYATAPTNTKVSVYNVCCICKLFRIKNIWNENKAKPVATVYCCCYML